MSTPQLLVNRNEFIAWTEGTLLHFKGGAGIAPDELLCEEAESILGSGGEIYLTHNNRIVSKLVLKNDAYQEIAL